MNMTGPFVEFSKGMIPWAQESDWTASKISALSQYRKWEEVCSSRTFDISTRHIFEITGRERSHGSLRKYAVSQPSGPNWPVNAVIVTESSWNFVDFSSPYLMRVGSNGSKVSHLWLWRQVSQDHACLLDRCAAVSSMALWAGGEGGCTDQSLARYRRRALLNGQAIEGEERRRQGMRSGPHSVSRRLLC